MCALHYEHPSPLYSTMIVFVFLAPMLCINHNSGAVGFVLQFDNVLICIMLLNCLRAWISIVMIQNCSNKLFHQDNVKICMADFIRFVFFNSDVILS